MNVVFMTPLHDESSAPLFPLHVGGSTEMNFFVLSVHGLGERSTSRV